MLSIVAGEYKGVRLQLPSKDTTRPISQKVRAAIFNVLGSSIEGVDVLDLYAGSGALGLEALSRGAQNATFVEHNGFALRTIRSNIALCSAQEKSEIIRKDVAKYIANCQKKFTCIFFDPPYADFDQTLLKHASCLLQLGGIVVVSLSTKTTIDPDIKILQEKTYGDTKIVFVS